MKCSEEVWGRSSASLSIVLVFISKKCFSSGIEPVLQFTIFDQLGYVVITIYIVHGVPFMDDAMVARGPVPISSVRCVNGEDPKIRLKRRVWMMIRMTELVPRRM